MSKRRLMLRWLMIAVTLCFFAGIAAAVDNSALPKPDTQDAMRAIERAAIQRATTEPMFKGVLTEIANAPQPEGMALPTPLAPPPPVRTPNVSYVYPWAANVAPPHYNPGIGFNLTWAFFISLKVNLICQLSNTKQH